jgi:hypothetical protein
MPQTPDPAPAEVVDEAVVDPAAEASPESRLNLGAANFMTSALQAICGVASTTPLTGQTLGLHSAAPGITGANAVAAVTRQALVWGAFSGGGATVATVSATALVFNNVAAGTYSHYGVYNSAGTFLYGKPLSVAVTIPTGATGTITVTASHTYDLV